MLDDKLKEIFWGWHKKIEELKPTTGQSAHMLYGLTDEDAIAQIKQAFAESFVLTPKGEPPIEVNNYDRNARYRTGQEWYSEFVHELKAFYTDLDIPQQEAALEAAKKASGQ